LNIVRLFLPEQDQSEKDFHPNWNHKEN
jgi:hypothetical protein